MHTNVHPEETAWTGRMARFVFLRWSLFFTFRQIVANQMMQKGLWCWDIRGLSFPPAGHSWWRMPKVIRNCDCCCFFVLSNDLFKPPRKPDPPGDVWWSATFACFEQTLAGDWSNLCLFACSSNTYNVSVGIWGLEQRFRQTQPGKKKRKQDQSRWLNSLAKQKGIMNRGNPFA